MELSLIKNRKIRSLIALFFLIGISSCSSKFIYNNLDWISYWYIDDFVTLSDAQETEFEPVLEQFLEWHRKTELQNYITEIKLIQTNINNGINRADLEGHLKAFRGFWQVMLIHLEPGLIQLAYSLKDKQIEEFLNISEQFNIDEIEEYQESSKQKYLENRLNKIERRLESFIGKLTVSQKQLINNSNDNLQATFYDWIAFRRAWADSIRFAFTLKDDKAAFETALRRSILQADTFRSDNFWTKIEYNQNLWLVTLEQLLNSLNTKQLKKLNTKLADIIIDLEDLL